jgi:hypothetical protein
MKANGHLDEGAARLLLDRATIKRDNGSLDFSRDIKVKITVIVAKLFINILRLNFKKILNNLQKMSTRDHYSNLKKSIYIFYFLLL